MSSRGSSLSKEEGKYDIKGSSFLTGKGRRKPLWCWEKGKKREWEERKKEKMDDDGEEKLSSQTLEGLKAETSRQGLEGVEEYLDWCPAFSDMEEGTSGFTVTCVP